MAGDKGKNLARKELAKTPDMWMSQEGERSFDIQREILLPSLAEGRGVSHSKDTKTHADMDTFFRETFISLLEKKGISLLQEELQFLDRKTPVYPVAENFGKDAAIAHVVACGIVVEGKSEQVGVREDVPEQLRTYGIKVTLISDGLFEVKSSSDEFRFTGRIDMGKESGSITVIDVGRKQDPHVLHLGEALGGMWEYVASKIQAGRDDMGKTINRDASQLAKYPKRLTIDRIENTEAKARMRQLLQGKMQRKGTLAIEKDSKGNWVKSSDSTVKVSLTPEEAHDIAVGALGTPLGYAAAFLPKQGKNVFGSIERTKLEIKFNYNSSDVIDIDSMTFHFEKKHAFPLS